MGIQLVFNWYSTGRGVFNWAKYKRGPPAVSPAAAIPRPRAPRRRAGARRAREGTQPRARPRASSVQFSPVLPSSNQVSPSQKRSAARRSSTQLCPPPKPFGRTREWARVSPPLGPEVVWLKRLLKRQTLASTAAHGRRRILESDRRGRTKQQNQRILLGKFHDDAP